MGSYHHVVLDPKVIIMTPNFKLMWLRFENGSVDRWRCDSYRWAQKSHLPESAVSHQSVGTWGLAWAPPQLSWRRFADLPLCLCADLGLCQSVDSVPEQHRPRGRIYRAVRFGIALAAFFGIALASLFGSPSSAHLRGCKDAGRLSAGPLPTICWSSASHLFRCGNW